MYINFRFSSLINFLLTFTFKARLLNEMKQVRLILRRTRFLLWNILPTFNRPVAFKLNVKIILTVFHQ